ncbi:SPOR domain-containing protein [Oceanimonas pelagia]|uniref:SPOR domain-containing protein n=1 Tax=Oceanimonas pelagia TaxID=3028314 RepID=A0AA50KPD2_9GAMM|nr:SPOR domain-containing protein [Oceanimonas pelagia]WMC11164.1 SPOR domain-containing protein [Oceanimonas pelagia]
MTAEALPTLSSQQQLLERLLHLFRLDQELVLLSGPKGAGKSTLAGLLARHSELLTPVVLDARLLTSQAAFREALLAQWFAGAVFDPDDSLLETMSRLLPAAPGRRLLVVDNGQWLTDPQLLELAELCLGLPAEQRPFMALLGLPSWAGGVRGLLRSYPALPVVELEVPELSEEDKWQLCLYSGVEPTAALLERLHYPGDLATTVESSMRTPQYRQWLENKSIKILLTGLILLGLVALVALLLGRQESRPEVAQPFQADSLPEAPAQPLTLAVPAEPATQEPATEPGSDRLVSDWPVEPLPDEPRVNTQVAESPDDSSKERVIIEDEVVSRLLRRDGDARPAPAAEGQPRPAPTAAPVALKQQPAGHYTLQLMASRDQNALNQLVSRHRLSPAWVYSRTLNGQPWYVLVHGDFATAEQARRAIGALPAELRAAKPWPKPFGQVQKEAGP